MKNEKEKDRNGEKIQFSWFLQNKEREKQISNPKKKLHCKSVEKPWQLIYDQNSTINEIKIQINNLLKNKKYNF